MNTAQNWLLPLSWLYGAGVLFRNYLFDWGILKSARVPVPVISVGNLSAGGVGKTPMVEFITRKLQEKGRKVAIVSRGYKRKSLGYIVVSDGSALTVGAELGGDEPAQMASKLKGAIVIADEQRDRGAKRAVSELGAEVIVLDDAFQHRYVGRNLDIVVMSANDLLRGDHLLPAGYRREPLRSLRRASLIIISRCKDIDHFRLAENKVREVVDKPIVGMRVRPISLHPVGGHRPLKLQKVKGKRVVAFSGIGDPASFIGSLSAINVQIVDHVVFRDHHRFSDDDLAKVSQAFSQNNGQIIVTTEKDYKRLHGAGGSGGEFIKQYPLYYLEIEPKILVGGEALDKVLETF